MNPSAPKVVIPRTTRREAIIAVAAGLVVLGCILYGVMHLSQPVTGNKLTGVVIAKEFKPMAERQVSFSGRKIEGVKEIDGEYTLKVRVDSQNRTYEVPVEKAVYYSKEKGDTLTFLRPRSEQR